MGPVWMLLALSLAGMAFATQQMGLLPILPQIQETFDVSIAWIAWTVSAFLLASAVATPAFAKLGDVRGKRTTLVGVLGISLAGTVLAAVATTMPLFIAGRVLQGVGAGAFALGFALARDLAPAGRSGAWIAALSAAFALGGAGAMAASGVIADAVSWRSLLWAAVPLHVVAIGAVLWTIPPSVVARRRRLDVPGALMLGCGVGALLLALTESSSWGWGSPQTVGLLAGGAIVLAGWSALEARIEDPLVPASMLALPDIARGNALAFATGLITFGALAIVPSMVQEAPFSYGPALTGLLLSLGTLPTVVSGPFAGVLERRRGATLPAAAGLGAMAGAMLLLAAVPGSHIALWAAMVLLGLGVGAAFTMSAVLVVDAVESTDTAVSASLTTVTRLLGGVLGAQLAATLVAAGVGFDMVFALGALAALPPLYVLVTS